MKIGMVSLGCPKNLYDSEVMLGLVSAKGWELTPDPGEADIIIVNTCGFIESAKEEAINTVLQMAEYKKEKCQYLIMTGCLAQRYADELMAELPEVDAFVGTECFARIAEVIENVQKGKRFILKEEPANSYRQPEQRILSTPAHFAYLKIAEGCDNCCSYCAIPFIRGPYRSRPYEEVVAEAKWLVEKGIKEIILVAQDTSRYGEDLYGRLRLPELLYELNSLSGIKWIRILYVYPQYMTDELIEAIASCNHVCKYIDLPLQHADNEILYAMNRPDTREGNTALIQKLRSRIPDLCLRSTFIVGFPGESAEQFNRLKEFLAETRFNCAGVFTYSPEEGTVAAKMPEQIDENVKEDRYNDLMAIQAEISEEIQQAREESIIEVVIEGFDEENPELAFARSAWEGPDIDGKVYVENAGKYQVGDFIQVKVLQGFTYDIVAEPVE